MFKDKKWVGLNISDKSMEVVQLEYVKGNIEVTALNRLVLPRGIIKEGKIVSKRKLKIVLRKLFREAKPGPIPKRNIIFSLPSSQSFLHVFYPENGGDLEGVISHEMGVSIPVESEKILYSYKKINRPDRKPKVIGIATRKKVLNSWNTFFKRNNYEIEQIRDEIFAVYRAIFPSNEKLPVCVVDMGSHVTNVALFDSQGLFYARSLYVGGDYFDKQIAKIKKIDKKKAEKLKIKYGLKFPDRQTRQILEEGVAYIIDGINKSLQYYKVKKNRKIKGVVFTGGGANLKGLSTILKRTTEVPIKRATIGIRSIKVTNYYLSAVGLGLYGFYPNWSKVDPQLKTELSTVRVEQVKEKNGKRQVKLKGLLGKSEESFASRNKKLLVLGSLVVLSLLLLVLAFWYRSYSREKKQEQTSESEQVVSYDVESTVEVRVKVALNSNNYSSTVVRGILLKNDVATLGAGVDSSQLEDSYTWAISSAGEQYSVWDTPVSIAAQGDSGVTSTISWAAYLVSDVERLALAEIEQELEGQQFILDTINYVKLDKTLEPNMYEFVLSVDVYLSVDNN